ncbi:WD40 repeat-like protein [Auriscalpium vulgare]|uniref:WD40 repeat-like protein n=1 Tax=Auriscalpium vulgare TaxID=40419 RepID=A0ACB8R4A7_9AGAM|nr:WD40 repeat-like protein [Auriscalpium vulgare]
MPIFASLRRRFSKVGDRRDRPSTKAETEGGTDTPQPSASPVAENQTERRQDGGNPFIAAKDDRATHGAGTSGSCRCSPHPKGGKGRNLVVCIDGTSNQFSEKNTNVVELYKSLIKDDDQLTYYDSGIGTYVSDDANRFSRWKQAVKHKGDMMFAWSFKKNVLNAYQWLSENYRDGDKIFLFGFSRGAYQVRVIAGMIEKVGLLHKGNNNQIQFAYEIYLSTTSKQRRTNQEQPSRTRKGKNPKTTKKQDDLCARFKETLSRQNVRVHFVGAWDTVSSIGTARGPSLPETTTGMKHVCFFRHGLALDEKRGKFLPELANGGDGPYALDDTIVAYSDVGDEGAQAGTGAGVNDGDFNINGVGKGEHARDNLKVGDSKGNVKEVWFAGSHSDIGGGIVYNPDANHFGPALRWMKYEAMTNGLRVSPQTDQWKELKLNLSVGLFFKIIDLLPYRRLSYKDRESTIRWPPHRGASRQVKPGQMIHQSVFERMGINTESKEGFPTAQSTQTRSTDYRTLARLPAGYTWETCHQALLEPDPYFSAVATIAELQEVAAAEQTSLSTAHREILEGLLHSEPGRVSLATAPAAGKVLLNTLDNSKDDVTSCSVLATAILAVGPLAAAEYSGRWSRELVSMLEHPPDTAKVYKDFIKMFRQISVCRVHESQVSSVAFSPDGNRIVSGSDDKTIRICDAHTGEMVLGPFAEPTTGVRSVGFSPDGAWVVSGSYDRGIRIWDPHTGQSVAGPFKGHSSFVMSVAFSPDSMHVVSGSKDKTLRIWNIVSGDTVAGPFRGHTGWVQSVMFSPDGTHVVSGSDDNTVRIWDAKTGKTVAGPLTGHTDWVWSVAFSPNGTRIVSGSGDRTICIWDAQTGEMVAGPFIGHTSWVWSVAFSPDGKRVVSGSADRTIRIWDAQTGETVVGPLRGHTSEVASVAYSPDGKLIASGSRDGTLCIWDAEVDEKLRH